MSHNSVLITWVQRGNKSVLYDDNEKIIGLVALRPSGLASATANGNILGDYLNVAAAMRACEVVLFGAPVAPDEPEDIPPDVVVITPPLEEPPLPVITPDPIVAPVPPLPIVVVSPPVAVQAAGVLTGIGAATAAGAGAYSIAITPDGRFAYVANATAATVSMYSINQSTSALTSIAAAIAAGAGATSVAVDPRGLFVYVANYNDSTVSMYSINQSTGALTSIAAAIAAGAGTNCVAVDPNGLFVYTANATAATVSMYSINQSTGALTSIGAAVAAGTLASSVAVDPTGRFAYVTNRNASTVSMYSINQSTGALTSIAAAVAAMSAISVAVEPTGRFAYVVNDTSGTVLTFSINQSTGALTALGSAIAAGFGACFIAVDPTGGFAYVVNFDDDTISIYSINQSTGALTSMGVAVATGDYPVGIAIHPAGNYAYVVNYNDATVSLYSTNLNMGIIFSRPLASADATDANLVGKYRDRIGIDPGDARNPYIDAAEGALCFERRENDNTADAAGGWFANISPDLSPLLYGADNHPWGQIGDKISFQVQFKVNAVMRDHVFMLQKYLVSDGSAVGAPVPQGGIKEMDFTPGDTAARVVNSSDIGKLVIQCGGGGQGRFVGAYRGLGPSPSVNLHKALNGGADFDYQPRGGGAPVCLYSQVAPTRNLSTAPVGCIGVWPVDTWFTRRVTLELMSAQYDLYSGGVFLDRVWDQRVTIEHFVAGGQPEVVVNDIFPVKPLAYGKIWIMPYMTTAVPNAVNYWALISRPAGDIAKMWVRKVVVSRNVVLPWLTVLPTPPVVVAPPQGGANVLAINDRVAVPQENTDVRSSAALAASKVQPPQLPGALGTIIGGPTTADNLVWWQVNFDVPADGWVRESRLIEVGTLPSTTPVDEVLSTWSVFGACVNSQQTRTRTVITPASNGGILAGPLTETQPCGSPPAGGTFDWDSTTLNAWATATGTAFVTKVSALLPAGFVDFAGSITVGLTRGFHAWCGAAMDYAAGKMWFGIGGHQDSSNNGLYEFDLETLTYRVAMQPTPITSAEMAASKAAWGTAWTSFSLGYNPTTHPDFWTDGKPTAIHTYGGIQHCSETSEVIRLGRLHAWHINPATGAFSQGASQFVNSDCAMSTYDAATNKFYCFRIDSGNTYTTYRTYDPITRLFGQMVSLGALFPVASRPFVTYKIVPIIVNRTLFLFQDHQEPFTSAPKMATIDLDTGVQTLITLVTPLARTNNAPHIYFSCGDYSPDTGKMYFPMRVGGSGTFGSFYTIDATTFACGTYTPTGTPPATPPSSANGPYSKIRIHRRANGDHIVWFHEATKDMMAVRIS